MTTRKRELAAIMFTDIVGFSAMMNSDEVRATVVRKRHREILRSAHERHGGKILQYYGDGTLSIFKSAVEAVECGVEMQVEFRRSPEVPLRIGIHTGDITYDDEGAYGDGMNIASRIETLCIPGAVYISAKVYDDIKNHSWLEAVSLGFFHLKNIFNEIELYAISSKNLPLPYEEELEVVGVGGKVNKGPVSRKNKVLAGVLGITLGLWGVHRFYLGQRKTGILFFALTVFSIIFTASGEFPLIAIMALVAFIDGIILLVMPQGEFDHKYNQAPRVRAAVAANKEKRKPRKRGVPAQEEVERNPYKKRGVRYFRSGKIEEAFEDFEEALKIDPQDPSIHFNLAACYSVFQEADPAFDHLAKAVKFGFKDFDKINKHDALEYLRSLDTFEAFVNNNYQVVSSLPAPREDLLASPPAKEPDILEQIANLGNLMEQGILTREEFDEQKKKLLED